MAEFIVLGAVSDVPSGTMKEFDAGGVKVMVAGVGDKFYALQGRCPHMGGVLAQGKLEGTVVTCPRHKSQFDVTDGHVVRWTSGAGLTYEIARRLKAPTSLKVYELKIADGNIQVKLSQ